MTKPKFDLAALDVSKASNKPYKLELKHPVTKEPLGMFISVLGRDSDVFTETMNESINADRRQRALDIKRGRDPKVETIEENMRDSVALMAKITVAFDHVEYNGPLSFSEANAVKLYTEQTWVLKQVTDAVNDIANFMQN
jgi:hypothetical protein